MMVSRQQQIQFYEDELRIWELEAKTTFESSALSLKEKGELFKGAYQGYDAKRGNIFIDFRKNQPKPRLDKVFLVFRVSQVNNSNERFSRLRYRDLLEEARHEVDHSELKVISYMKADNPDFIRAICRDVSVAFQESLKREEIICIGPNMPPFGYLQNLMELSQQLPSGRPTRPWEKLLLLSSARTPDRLPELLTEQQDILQMLLDAVHNHRVVALQGLPGTGKTHQIAELISRIISQDKSVLLTAQTNRSVVEVCAKSSLAEPLARGQIRKTSLSSSEKAAFPHLERIKDITAIKSTAVLTTYYRFSDLWVQYSEPIFDYIIVEEASQAFLTTLAGAIRLAQYVIVVGDPYQLFPIVKNRTYKDNNPDLDHLVYGLQTLCEIAEIPYFRKVETRRLMPRATEYTNLFYQNTIRSLSLITNLSDDCSKLGNPWSSIIPKMGGPVWCAYSESAPPRQLPQTAIHFLEKLIEDLYNKIPSVDIAVLTPFTRTLADMQGVLRTKFPNAKLLVETIDRVQGLDVDYCFVLIPPGSYTHSLEWHRFNVATSRARKATFLIAPDDMLEMASGNINVKVYLDNLKKDGFVLID